MTDTKEMSKRQQRREQMRRKEMRGKLLGIGLVSVGALFLAFLFIYPNIKPAAAVIAPEAVTYKQVDVSSQGDPNAPVRIDVYEDFQCPACRNFSSDIEPLIVKNLVETGKVYYTFHNYPFIDGKGISGGESDQAANAAMCAAEQGKFWEMHATIFANWNGENLGAYADPRLRAFAQSAGLNMNDFDSCFSENKYKTDIQASFDAGDKLGVNGTPSVFVNDQIVAPGYVPSYQQIEEAVNAALAGN
ncbi:MAG: thioredoxin domain-containing protein [Anaerolineales bacterium]